MASYFLLVYALSVPFWLVGAATGAELRPHLPVAALMAVCPTAAALILIYRARKGPGVVAFLRRSCDCGRFQAKIWYLPTLLLMPAVMGLSYLIMRWLGVPVPPPSFSVVTAVSLFVILFIAALSEELGWSGYAIDPLQARWGALPASLFVGIVWAVWHIVPLVEAHRAPAWIAWWGLGTVALRVLIVWLYDNTERSVCVAALFHTMVDVTWLLFPVGGSYYDPRVTSSILAVVAAIVTVVWGPRTLARFRTP